MCDIKDYTIYVVECQENKYYVGKTQRDITVRFNEHFTGNGSSWTKLYPPLRLLETKKGDKYEEGAMTLRMMEKYGIAEVRGGIYCKTKLTKQEINEITRQIAGLSDMCYKCHLYGHFTSKCSSQIPDVTLTTPLPGNKPQIDIKSAAIAIVSKSVDILMENSLTAATTDKEDLGMFSFGDLNIHFDSDRKAIYTLDKPLPKIHMLESSIPTLPHKVFTKFKALELLPSSNDNMTMSTSTANITSKYKSNITRLI